MDQTSARKHVSFRDAFTRSRQQQGITHWWRWKPRQAVAGGAGAATDSAVSGGWGSVTGAIVTAVVAVAWMPLRNLYRVVRGVPAAREAILAERDAPLREELATLKARQEWWGKCRVQLITPIKDPKNVELCGQLVRSLHVLFMPLAGSACSLLTKLGSELEARRTEPASLLWKYISQANRDLMAAQDEMVGFATRDSGVDPRQVFIAAWVTYRRVFDWLRCLTERMPGTADSEEYTSLRNVHDQFVTEVRRKATELKIRWILDNLASTTDSEQPC